MAKSTASPEAAATGFETGSLPGWVYDPRTTEVLAVNDAALTVSGFTRGELLGTELARLSPDGAPPAQWQRFRRRDGRIVEIEVCASIPVAHAAVDARLDLFAALVDEATQLPNRTALLRTASTGSTTLLLVRVAWSAGSVLGGQAAHDAAARAAAQVIEPLAPSGAMVARYGDGVFAIRLSGGRARPAATLARRLLAAFERPIPIADAELSATPVIGIASGDDLFRQARGAEAALEHAAASGTSIETFDEDLAAAHDRHAVIERNLRHAILDARVTVVFQPIVSLRTTDVVGAEALMRWDCPGLGPVSPAEFIAVAERSRAILRLGEWILREGCAQNKRWQLDGLPPIRITVNVSPRQVADRDFVKLINGIVESTSLEPSALEIELTGTAVVARDHTSRRALEAVRRLGVRVSIDDFGSGYSSISDLGSLPADTLKLDRAFVQELGKDRFKTEAARAVIGLAHLQGLSVVGVGVESADQVAVLRDMGCDEAQGFLLGAPIAADRFGARLERGRMRAEVDSESRL
jgi:EAL domain-containing protein (putative c-di-GMP-specific phosphodiesterase class I)/GGDEF domain-containing protein